MDGNVNVEVTKGDPNHNNVFDFDKKIKSIKWLDDGLDVYFTQENRKTNIVTTSQFYGAHMVVKIAKIEVE